MHLNRTAPKTGTVFRPEIEKDEDSGPEGLIPVIAFGSYDAPEIARVTNKSADAVKSDLYRARRTLLAR